MQMIMSDKNDPTLCQGAPCAHKQGNISIQVDALELNIPSSITDRDNGVPAHLNIICNFMFLANRPPLSP